MRPRTVRPEGKGDPVAELEVNVANRFAEGEELAAKHAQERIEMDICHRDRLLRLASQNATELTELEARQLEELAALWKRQGRQLGAWATGELWRGDDKPKNGRRGRHGAKR